MNKEEEKVTVQSDATDHKDRNEDGKAKEQKETDTVVSHEEQEDTRTYKIIVNHEEQYSIWFADRENPKGWRDEGKVGTREDCLAHIKKIWTDIRPLNLRKKMEEMEKKRPELEREHARRIKEEKKKPEDSHDNLVKYLSEDTHPIEAGLRPEKTVKLFKEALDQGYVHVKFTDTRGGTELGVRLDSEACDFTEADFKNSVGYVHIEGTLALNYVKVRCIADIKLESLEGEGHLVIVEEQNNKIEFKQG